MSQNLIVKVVNIVGETTTLKVKEKSSSKGKNKKKKLVQQIFSNSNTCLSVKPVDDNGNINHGFLKDYEVRNADIDPSGKHYGWYKVLGFYYCSNKSSDKYGQFRFVVVNGEKRTDWWFDPNDLNKSIVFKDMEADMTYRTADYSKIKVSEEKLED